ncbi:MAG: AlpA family phage regulatory protein [Yoonia sp.]|nr:AlpA family phage regulatory protein [Yoonia sp.]
MTNEILRKPRVLALIGIGNTSLHAAIKRGDFPAPVKLGVRAVGWRRSDIENWLDSRETKVT